MWKKLKKKVAITGILALLVVSLGFVSAVPISAVAHVGQMNVFAMNTGVDISNTTGQMTTLFVTLITLMIPLIIIMAYLGIFQDFIGAIGRAFGGLFGRH